MAVETGRTLPRSRTYQCHSCGIRNAVGEPKALDTWPARLHIERHQIDLLLAAAAEFRDLCDEAGEYADAVSFVDWVRPDALSAAYSSPVKAEPAPVTLAEKRRRHENGRVA